jgi:hypothetical protein
MMMTPVAPQSSVVLVPSGQPAGPAFEAALAALAAAGHPVWRVQPLTFDPGLLDRMTADALAKDAGEVLVLDPAGCFEPAYAERLWADPRPFLYARTPPAHRPAGAAARTPPAVVGMTCVRRPVLIAVAAAASESPPRFFAPGPGDPPGRKGAITAFRRRARLAGFPVTILSLGRPPIPSLSRPAPAPAGDPARSFPAQAPAIQAAFDLLDGFLDVLDCTLNFQAVHPAARAAADGAGPFHTTGGLQRALGQGRGVHPADFRAWVDDPEHGLFHCLSVALLAVVWAHRGRPAYRAGYERLIASCLVHDFLRPGGLNDRHDARLADWFAHLDEATYTHSDPHPDLAAHPLIVGDRLELARYPDHAAWVDPAVIGPYLGAEPLRTAVPAYFRFVRPAMLAVYRGRDDVWLRHGEESDEILSTADAQGDGVTGTVELAPGAFPRRYWAPRPGYWCVEIGSAPFGGNIVRDLTAYSPLGLLSLADYRRHSAHPIIPVRDHQAAAGRVPPDAWVCLLSPDDLRRERAAWLLSRCGGMVRLDQANRFLRAARQLADVLAVLRADAAAPPVADAAD